MEKLLLQAKVLENAKVGSSIYKMVFYAPEISQGVQPGQFVNIRKMQSGVFLRRPFSVADAEPDKGTVTILYRLVGTGTKELSAVSKGEMLDVEGPLGQGFSIKPGKSLLIGGGVGIAPLIFLSRTLDKPILLIGGKNKEETFWTEFLAPFAEKIYITTDDGSVGKKGFAVDALPEILAANDVDSIAVCGPMVMMKGIAAAAAKADVPCEVSMEKRMACGFGVCVGCSFQGNLTGKRRKVCSDGPVFPAGEVFA